MAFAATSSGFPVLRRVMRPVRDSEALSSPQRPGAGSDFPTASLQGRLSLRVAWCASVNLTDFVQSFQSHSTAARRLLPAPRLSPKQRRDLHISLLRQRQLSLSPSPEQRKGLNDTVSFLSRSSRERGATPGRLHRGLTRSSGRKDVASPVPPFTTVGKGVGLASKTRPRTSIRITSGI